jgi:hypothetical protein
MATIANITPVTSRLAALVAELPSDPTRWARLTCSDAGELHVNDKKGLYPENIKADCSFTGTATALGTTADISSLGLPFNKLKFTKSAAVENATVRLAINGTGSVMFMISGLTSETIAVTALIDGTNETAGLGVMNTAGTYSAATALGNGTYRLVVQGGTGTVTVGTALPTGTNTLGAVTPKPTTSGGLSISRTLSAASTNATSVKGSAGQVYTIYAHNTNAAVRYLKI